MPDEPARLGDCPDCGENIAPAWTLVEYERSDGSEAVWAECPACEAVVEPE